MKKLLFVCSENRLRSPTAEAVFSEYAHVEAIGCGTNSDAARPLSAELITWADIVFVMEKHHRNKALKRHYSPLQGKRLICLDIPDIYDRMDPVLISQLKTRVSRYL